MRRLSTELLKKICGGVEVSLGSAVDYKTAEINGQIDSITAEQLNLYQNLTSDINAAYESFLVGFYA